jgi:hypothetical protein
VPSAQESTAISNWLQDGVIARMQAAHPQDKGTDDKSTGVPYHTRLFRGRYVYMVHTMSAVLQEMVANTLGGHKALAVSPKLYRWIPHNASFGFLDLTPSILLLRQFWD